MPRLDDATVADLRTALEHIESVQERHTTSRSQFEARRLSSAADDIRLVLKRRYNVTPGGEQ